MQKKAFVTGGTGFIGINLIKLLLEEGWEVTALHRASSDLTYLGKLPVKRKVGSVTDLNSLVEAFPNDIDTVFHLAGDTGLWARNNDIQTAVNVNGTSNMLKTTLRFDVKHFIFTSSASVWSDISTKHIHEGLQKKGNESWVNYERSKWLAEQEVLKYAGSKMKVVILNPTTVTGPYDVNNWGKLFNGLKQGKLPGIPNGKISVTHVKDVAVAHLQAVEKGKNANSYILSGVDCHFKTLIREISNIIQIEKIPPSIPDFVFKSLAQVQCLTSLFTRKKPDLTPELVKIMTRKNLSYSNDKAKQELGYQITPLRETLQDCYHWLVKEGYL